MAEGPRGRRAAPLCSGAQYPSTLLSAAAADQRDGRKGRVPAEEERRRFTPLISQLPKPA